MKAKKSNLIAVIDIGAHSIRLYIGHILRKGIFKQVENLWVPIPIGLDTFNTGNVSNHTIRDLIKIIKNFKQTIDEYQINTVKAIATSSIREAGNSDVLIERIANTTGIQVEIIEPITEIEVLYNNIKKVMKDRYGFLKDSVLIFSLGGGGTQIVLQDMGEVVFTETYNQGTLRLLKSFDLPAKLFEYILKPLAASFTETVSHFSDITEIIRFVVVNDDVLNLIKITHREKDVQGIYRLTTKKFRAMYDEVIKMGPEKMTAKFGLNENVSGTTWVAFLMIGLFFNLTGAKEVLFPDLSMSSALLNQLSFGDEQIIRSKKSMRENIISAAIHLGKKYCFDRQHAELVAQLSASIFDQIQEIYGFGNQEKLYLEIAALLHDIGAYIAAGSHHKHSYLLISSCEIMGLSKREIKIIALIARYHRKAIPKPSHPEYMSLKQADRITVARLSAILRIADGIDASHLQLVKNVKIELDAEICHITVTMTKGKHEYFDVVKYTVAKKSDLFENFFGLKVEMEIMI